MALLIHFDSNSEKLRSFCLHSGIGLLGNIIQQSGFPIFGTRKVAGLSRCMKLRNHNAIPGR